MKKKKKYKLGQWCATLAPATWEMWEKRFTWSQEFKTNLETSLGNVATPCPKQNSKYEKWVKAVFGTEEY